MKLQEGNAVLSVILFREVPVQAGPRSQPHPGHIQLGPHGRGLKWRSLYSVQLQLLEQVIKLQYEATSNTTNLNVKRTKRDMISNVELHVLKVYF